MAAAIGHRLILQIALAALIADRAIERMVDQQEFHHAFARGLDHRRGGEDFLIVGGGQRATRLRLGRPRLHLAEAHPAIRSEEHTSELQSLMRLSYAALCLKKKK